MSTTQRMDGIQSVATTIEKIGLEDGRELQWLIRNFDVIHSSSLNQITQNFGPLNGKVLIKLDLTKNVNGQYELGVRAQPSKDIMWMSFQFKMNGGEFSISGDPREVSDNRLSHTLTISSKKELKFTFKPEMLLSVADVVVGTPMEGMQFEQATPTPNTQQSNTNTQTPPFSFINPQWANALPTFLQQTLNQRVAECNHWANFFTNYPTELNQMQQHLTSILTNSELIRESPRMVQGLLTELRNNPDYSTVNQRIQEFMAGARQQCEHLRTQMQQNQPTQQFDSPQQNAETPNESIVEIQEQPTQNSEVPNVQPIQMESLSHEEMGTVEQPKAPESTPQQAFPPSIETVQHLFQQLPAEQRVIREEAQKTIESANKTYEDCQTQFENSLQQYQDLINFSSQIQPEQSTNDQTIIPSAPIIEPSTELTQEPMESSNSNVVSENNVVSQKRAHSTTSNSSHQNDSAWTFVFATKGITGYVRHVKNLPQRVPYHRNFCTAQNWNLPTGKEIKVELVHALHPDAPFICLFDYDNATDLFFVQTLLDGNGQEIHKIDSFSNSYHGFTSDMLLKSAEIDDVVRIRIDAIADLD